MDRDLSTTTLILTGLALSSAGYKAYEIYFNGITASNKSASITYYCFRETYFQWKDYPQSTAVDENNDGILDKKYGILPHWGIRVIESKPSKADQKEYSKLIKLLNF